MSTAQWVVAIVLIANGFFINYMASHGKLRGKSVRRIGFLTLFTGVGLLIPFPWFEFVSLPWWAGIAGGLILACMLIVTMAVTDGMRRSLPRRRR